MRCRCLTKPCGRRRVIFRQVLIVIFMLELVLNMTAYWGWEFWGDGWHLFDAFIIFLCVMELILPEDMPGVKQMRVLKTLRILRVFKRSRAYLPPLGERLRCNY